MYFFCILLFKWKQIDWKKDKMAASCFVYIFEASEENIYSVKFTFLFVQFQTYLSFFWIFVHQLKNTHDHWKTAACKRKSTLLTKTKPCSDYYTLFIFNKLFHYFKPVYIWDMSLLSFHSNNKILWGKEINFISSQNVYYISMGCLSNNLYIIV